MRVAALHRYPVKGLSSESIETVQLEAGGHVPGDRLFAVENGPSGFYPAEPRWQPKIKFLMLMRNESLARLRTRFEDATSSLVIEEGGREQVRADLSTPQGRVAIEALLRRFMPRELRGPPKMLAAPDGFRFTDSRHGYVSVINRASVAALERLTGRPVDPLRFRGNVLLDGLEPWAEFDLVGRTLAGPSGLELKITSRITRCAAVDVDPDTGERDMDLPRTLMQQLGHMACGVYAEVTGRGALRTGDALGAIAPAQGTLALSS